MKQLVTSSLLWFALTGIPALAGTDGSDCSAACSDNVNSRYLVESVELRGKSPSEALKARLSKDLRSELEKLVGNKFDQTKINDITSRIRDELHVTRVTAKVERGEQAEHVRVVIETKGRRLDEDATVTKLAYQSKEGWTGGLEVANEYGPTQLVFGIQSDGDTLLERQAGINARVSESAGDRVRLKFAFEDFHEQWNRATMDALESRRDVPGIYRTRRTFLPSVTIALTRALTLTAGVSFTEMQTQFPEAHIDASNALAGTLRYHQQFGFSDSPKHEIEAGYVLHAATHALGSDFVYARHFSNASYSFETEHNLLQLRLILGALNGRAPLFERFSAGNSQTLRGWNKFELDPLGGDRLAHVSVDYKYRLIGVFLDTGSVWDRGHERKTRQAAGVTLVLGGLRDGLTLSVGFPLHEGHMEPLFVMSMNF
jgi:hypothetical protein